MLRLSAFIVRGNGCIPVGKITQLASGISGNILLYYISLCNRGNINELFLGDDVYQGDRGDHCV